MTRLILDTNALRRGHFSAKALGQWMKAVGEDADIVIPEVVIWEWAEHAASAYSTLQSQLQGFSVDPGLYKRPTLADQRSIVSLVQHIKGLLPSSVDVWSPPSSVWKQGVMMDQVLQIGSGERKEGVKTGAADSIVLACVQKQVDDRRNAEAVLLATKRQTHEGEVFTPFRWRGADSGEHRRVAGTTELNAFEPAEDELYEETEQVLRELVTDPRSEIDAALNRFDMGFRIHVSEQSPARPADAVPYRDLARLGRVEIVGLHDLRVANQKNKGRVGLADVRIFADVHMTELQLRNTSFGRSEWVTTFDGPITHGFVDVTVAVTWDRHWKVQTVSPTGPAVIVFDSPEYDDLDDVPPFHANTVAGN